MAVIQISKIQLRRGLYSEVQPENLSPGEMGFALDEGRLFIGTDPDITGVWSERELPPYDAVEVLTETSIETFARMFDRLHRTLGPVGLAEGIAFTRRPYLEAELAIASSWTTVQVKRADAGTGLYETGQFENLILAQDASVGAVVTYFLMDDENVVRSGTLTVLHDGSVTSDVARVIDESLAYPKIAGNGTPILVSQLFTTGVQFRALREGNEEAGYTISLEYKNTEAVAYTMQLRVMVAARLDP